MYSYCSTEHVKILSNIICTSRQLNFEIFKDNNVKIGMNTTNNKFFHLSKQISLNNLNLTFVHYKKMMKLQYLKFGKT